MKMNLQITNAYMTAQIHIATNLLWRSSKVESMFFCKAKMLSKVARISNIFFLLGLKMKLFLEYQYITFVHNPVANKR